jgi:hypothetical protein
MEMVAERNARRAEINSSEVTDVEPTDHAQSAAETAAAVLAAHPEIGPVEVIHIGPNDDVADRRFMLIVFGGEAAFLIDRDVGRTTPIDLDDCGLTGEDRLRAKLDSAIAVAAREKLAKVYVVKHP